MNINVQIASIDGDIGWTQYTDDLSILRLGALSGVGTAYEKRDVPSLTRRAVDILTKESSNADVYLSLGVYKAGFVTTFAAQSNNKAHLVSARGIDVSRNLYSSDHFAEVSWVLQRASAIACVNHYLENRIISAFPEYRDKTCVVLNSIETKIDHDFSNNIRNEIGWNQNDIVCIFIGRLRPKIGASFLLKSIVKMHMRGVRLLVIGVDPFANQSDSRLSLDDKNNWDILKHHNALYCTGEIPREQVAEHLSNGDVLMAPSVDDGLANALLEGMSHGLCPIV
jgi:hypothetical protein